MQFREDVYGYDEKQAIEGYTRYLRDQGDTSDEVTTTPFHSKVYTDTPATRSPFLTVFLAVIILAVLTLIALAALYWFQNRSAMRVLNDAEEVCSLESSVFNQRATDLVLRQIDQREYFQ